MRTKVVTPGQLRRNVAQTALDIPVSACENRSYFISQCIIRGEHRFYLTYTISSWAGREVMHDSDQ